MRVFSYRHTEAGIRARAKLAGRELPRATPLRPRVKPVALPAPEPAEIVPTVESEIQKLTRRGMPDWVRGIVAAVAVERGVDIEALAGMSRNRTVVVARGEVFYKIKTGVSPVTGLTPTYPLIAKWFGREHTGILYSVCKHAKLNGLPLETKHDVFKQIKRRREASYERSTRMRQHREAAR